MRIGRSASALTDDTTTAAVNSSAAKTSAAVANPAITWALETVRE